MSRKAVLICPGRGTYNAEELGYLARHHADRSGLFARFDAIRAEARQEAVTALDGAEKFSRARHTRGDVASPLIYASSFADAEALADDIDVVAVTGNSMGWYIALAAAGALSPEDGFRVANTMGTLMQEHLIGGQLVYPIWNEDWQPDAERRDALMDQVVEINARDGHDLALSIDLGGMLVLAGNASGLDAFDAAVPQIAGRFPLRLTNHAAFHTGLQDPVAELGRTRLSPDLFMQPKRPMIDGRGHIWWPGSSDLGALWGYTLGAQVVEPYDFARAIQVAAEAFAPDLFIVTGPGATLGGAVAQSLIKARWKGMGSKTDFQLCQSEAPLLVSMGMAEQRVSVV